MKYIKNKKGNAMIITVILLMVVSILGVTMMFSVTNEIRINKSIEETTVAKYLAQAGIDHALYLIENNDGSMEYPYNEEFVMGDRTRVYELSIDEDGDSIIIASRGWIEKDGVVKKKVTLEAVVDEDGNVVVE